MCCGTSFFLKNNFGGGYKLNLEFESRKQSKLSVVQDLLEGYEYDVLENSKTSFLIELKKEQGRSDLSNLFLKLDSQECKSKTGMNS